MYFLLINFAIVYILSTKKLFNIVSTGIYVKQFIIIPLVNPVSCLSITSNITFQFHGWKKR